MIPSCLFMNELEDCKVPIDKCIFKELRMMSQEDRVKEIMKLSNYEIDNNIVAHLGCEVRQKKE